MAGEYLELVPHERIVFTLGWETPDGTPTPVAPGSTRVEVTLAADGNATILTLRHYDVPPAAIADHEHGWAHFLALLAEAAAEGR
jgi:uncharacterized protein YndB with AHSA1/START domain